MADLVKIIIRTPCMDCSYVKEDPQEVTEEEMGELCDQADQEKYDMDHDEERGLYVFTRNNHLCPACTDKFNAEQDEE